MKKLLILIAVCAVSNAYAGISCVYTKTKTMPDYSLKLDHPITVYRDPNTASQSKQITELGAYYVVGKKDGFIKLADARYYDKNPAYAFSGWGKAADFEPQDFRSCTTSAQ